MIHFNCPACSKSFRVKDEVGGRKSKCPHCGAAFVVPSLTVQNALPPNESTSI